MCSVDDSSDLMLQQKPKFKSGACLCMKCKELKAQVVIRVNDPFCRNCFLLFCTHKFRSAFGKSKVIRDGERVLVAFSGGPSSTAMLHLVKEGKSVRAQKKLRFNPGILFIDEGAVLGLDAMQRSEVCRQVTEQVCESGYPFHCASLEQAVDSRVAVASEEVEPSGSHDGELSMPSSSIEKLCSLLANLKSLTAKEHLIKTLRTQLILRIARLEGYSKVIVADTSTRLSARILANIAQGKGAHIPYDTSLVDDREADLPLVRPMREFTTKEVALYNFFQGLEPLSIPALTTKAVFNASIEKLTEAFVNGLQDGFTSTIQTIMRTSDKLGNTSDGPQIECPVDKADVGQVGLSTAKTEEPCCICLAPLDTLSSTCSALWAVHSSELITARRMEAVGQNGSHAFKAGPSPVSRVHILESCCYCCQQLVREMSDVSKLPDHVLQRVIKSTKQKEMKKLIGSHLL